LRTNYFLLRTQQMKVYKFGGASVRSAEGVRNIVSIVSGVKDELVIVISAMGKTTNAMEAVLAHFMKGDDAAALGKLQEVESYHTAIVGELFMDPEKGLKAIRSDLDELKQLITDSVGDDYDRWYDRLVSYGEILSTRIVSAYFTERGIDHAWLDMRKLLVTDSNFRAANVRMDDSQQRITAAVAESGKKICIGQGFIGTNPHGEPTTLGREGSDYTAAVVGNLLNAESVTIWKDVPGILNADPRVFSDTVHIPELTYLDAVDMALSGAQVIHPKTIKPLENKQIPLYVRPFSSPHEAGSVIRGSISKPIDVPVYIQRKDQALLLLSPLDFSFVVKENLSVVFTIMHKHRLMISMIQSSAVTLSVCVSNDRYLPRAIDELSNYFKVEATEKLEILTIRGPIASSDTRLIAGREVIIAQHSPGLSQYLMKEL
jgi:aspartate kinase